LDAQDYRQGTSIMLPALAVTVATFGSGSVFRIEAFFGDGSPHGLVVYYAVEGKPLGSPDSIGAVLDLFGYQVVMTNGDLLTTFDISIMIRFPPRAGRRRHDGRSSAGAENRVRPRRRRLGDAYACLPEKPSYQHLVGMAITF
jgi:hypothetical protein